MKIINIKSDNCKRQKIKLKKKKQIECLNKDDKIDDKYETLIIITTNELEEDLELLDIIEKRNKIMKSNIKKKWIMKERKIKMELIQIKQEIMENFGLMLKKYSLYMNVKFFILIIIKVLSNNQYKCIKQM